MKTSIVLLLLSLFFFQYKYSSKNNLFSSEKVISIDSLLIDDCNNPVDSIIVHQQYPWSSDHKCQLGNYNVQGVIPNMLDSLTSLSLEERLTNGLNHSKARSNYHGVDYTSNGKHYSAAIDISVRCLSDDQIRSLLDELSMKGFAGWYRKKGEDGWNGSNHIHAIWVASPLKPQLITQVKKWLAGKNGLTSDDDYKFWTPRPIAIERIRSAFTKSNPNK